MLFRKFTIIIAILGSCCYSADSNNHQKILSLPSEWFFRIDGEATKKDNGAARDWYKKSLDVFSWEKRRIDKPVNNMGVFWYRTSIKIPQQWQNSEIVINAGNPDDGCELYVNGKSRGTFKYGEPAKAIIPAEELNTKEDITIAIRVWNWYRQGGVASGKHALERICPFAQEDVSIDELPLDICKNLPANVMSSPYWHTGRHDPGTSNTRPEITLAKGDFKGKDAVCFHAKYPNASSEFVDVRLPAGKDGKAWDERQDDYLSFWCKSLDVEGEMLVNINNGNYHWGKNGPNYLARFYLKPGEYRRVILPFSAFLSGDKRMSNTSALNTISIGYRNNELHSPGKVFFSDFSTGRFAITGKARSIPLKGLWKFKIDKPDKGGKDEPGLSEGWYRADFNDKDWDVINIGLPWEAQGYAYNGVAWYRAKVDIPEDWKGLPLHFEIGYPDDMGEVYINGKKEFAVEKFGTPFTFDVAPEKLQYGKTNIIAIRIKDGYKNGGVCGGSYRISPLANKIGMRRPGENKLMAPEDFDMGTKADEPVEMVISWLDCFGPVEDLTLQYRVTDCFFRTVIEGESGVQKNGDKDEVVLEFKGDAAKRLYYGEWFSVYGLLKSAKGEPLYAMYFSNRKLDYSSRDKLSLPQLEQGMEDTPYGKLKLVDVIECAVDPASDPHPYKEGGIRASWVGRRAYKTWENGIRVNEFNGRKYREAGNNEHFGYRVGRGVIKPHTPYLLRVRYPEDKTRYFAMDIKAGRNYQGTGFMNGRSKDDPEVNYPLTGKYEWYDNFFITDDMAYGYRGARTCPVANGVWVFFHDIGRCYAGNYEAGPAVAEIRLYEVTDIPAAAPKINYPEGLPSRTLMMDWEREPRAPGLDVANYARLMGMNAIGPVIQKWTTRAHWPTKLGFENVKYADRPESAGILEDYLKAGDKTGVGIIPRIEYGGSLSLPKKAWCIADSGKIYPAGRFASWGANILHPATWNEISVMLDEIVGDNIQKHPSLKGILWRMRSDRIAISYGLEDIKLFCKENSIKLPKANARQLALWVSRGNMSKQYEQWWQKKRKDFHVRIRDKLQNYRKDMKLYYYNWDADGWHLGDNKMSPEDMTNYFDINNASKYFARRKEMQQELNDQDYVDIIKRQAVPHRKAATSLYADVEGIAYFAPIHWRYLANNKPYLEYFKTGNGTAICNMFNYEEKARWNVQGDNLETFEMTPGGPDFAVAEEVQAFFHCDPNVMTTTTYTYGRGFAQTYRRFAKAFLALPDIKSTVVPNSNSDVMIRRYDAGKDIYVSVAYRGAKPLSMEVTIPVEHEMKVIDLVSGKEIGSNYTDGKVTFTVTSPAMQLNSYRLTQKSF